MTGLWRTGRIGTSTLRSADLPQVQGKVLATNHLAYKHAKGSRGSVVCSWEDAQDMPVYSWEKSAKSRVSDGRVHEGKTCFTGARGRSLVEARVTGGRAHWGNRGARFSRV